MTVVDLFVVLGAILAVVALAQSYGRNLAAWAVLFLAAAMLLGAHIIRT